MFFGFSGRMTEKNTRFLLRQSYFLTFRTVANINYFTILNPNRYYADVLPLFTLRRQLLDDPRLIIGVCDKRHTHMAGFQTRH